MVLAVKVSLRDAERAKQYLRKQNLFRKGYRYAREEGSLLLPVKEEFDAPFPATFLEYPLPAVQQPSLKEELRAFLTDEEVAHLKTSMDLVGTVAIIEVAPELEAKEELIGQAILRRNKQVKTVVKKLGGHEGELRLQRYKVLAGEPLRETMVKENGVVLKIDLAGVYYSVRSATERKRVARQVAPGERVLVMFSGAGPYVCVIAKQSKEVVGIELNERGHELAVENCRLNKLSNVTLIQGDVREVVPELARRNILFDRIVMPLPHTGADFLDYAFMVAHEGTVIHLYDFEREFAKAAEKAKAGAARNKRNIKVLRIVPCGQQAPRVYRVCVDFVVEGVVP